MKRRGTVLRGRRGNGIPACRCPASRDRCRLTPVPGQQGRQAAGRTRRHRPISHYHSGRHGRWGIAGAIGDTAAQFVCYVARTRFSRTVFALRTLWARSCRGKRLATDDGRQNDRPQRHDQPVRGAVSHDCSPRVPSQICGAMQAAPNRSPATGSTASSRRNRAVYRIPRAFRSETTPGGTLFRRDLVAPSVMPRLQLPGTHSRCKESAFARLED